jgi:hypothetical protein
MQFEGNHIRVDMACPPRKKMKGEGPSYDRKRTVFVGNLPFDVKVFFFYFFFIFFKKVALIVNTAALIGTYIFSLCYFTLVLITVWPSSSFLQHCTMSGFSSFA